MVKKARGINAAKALQKRRKDSRWKEKSYVRRILGLRKKSDPLVGTSQAKAIVLTKVEIEAKQPN